MTPKSFRKSPRFQCLSPSGHFGTPWLILYSIFARLGARLASLWSLGTLLFCSILLDRVYFWPSVVIVTAMSALFQSRCSRKYANLYICIKILDFLQNLPMKSANLHITKHYVHFGCKQTSSGNNVPTNTRVNGQRRGRRDSRSANNFPCRMTTPSVYFEG